MNEKDNRGLPVFQSPYPLPAAVQLGCEQEAHRETLEQLKAMTAERDRMLEALEKDLAAFEQIYYCEDDDDCDSPDCIAIDRIEELKGLVPSLRDGEWTETSGTSPDAMEG
jgi:hypothetical protein